MQIRVQKPQNSSDVTTSDVYCVVVEEGNHTLDEPFMFGTKRDLEAYKVSSDQTNTYRNWSNTKMEHPSYQKSYSMPVVLGQVITYNDPRFSVFWTSNGNRQEPPDKDSLYVGKHTGEERIRYRADETLGFIVGAPHEGKQKSVFYNLATGEDKIKGAGNSPPYSYSFSSLAHTNYRYGDGSYSLSSRTVH